MGNYRSRYYENRERKQRLGAACRRGIRHGYYRTKIGDTTARNVLDWLLKGEAEGFSVMQDPQSGHICRYLETDLEKEEERMYRDSYLKGSEAAEDGLKMPKLKY